jgi:hypothetical protein
LIDGKLWRLVLVSQNVPNGQGGEIPPWPFGLSTLAIFEL